MPQMHSVVEILGLMVVGLPTILMFLLGITSLLEWRLSERAIGRCVQAAVSLGLLASIVMLVVMISLGTRHVPLELGNWVKIEGEHFHYHFAVKFVFDRLSIPFVILTYLLCGTIGAFAVRYMHREPGFNRFFALYSLFMFGMIVTSLAGTIETLFAGWEMVGLSSAMLVAFYHERPAPVHNGLRVWTVYRISDAALLFAAVALHHMVGGGDFDKFLGSRPWPEGEAVLTSGQALLVGSLLLVAAAGKSALVPFSGWLPRAMEGPTPSSAVFYGALSVHLGAFLLLRASPLLDKSPGLSAAVLALGLLSSLFSSFACRVQTDIKSALSFASLTQVGFITAEIGLASLLGIILKSPGLAHFLRYFTLIHILGHGCLRTLQFIRAPTLLHDYRILENAIGAHLPHQTTIVERYVPARARTWFYRFALERGYLDSLMTVYLVSPVLGVLRYFDSLERRWTAFLAGERRSRQSAASRLPTTTIDE